MLNIPHYQTNAKQNRNDTARLPQLGSLCMHAVTQPCLTLGPHGPTKGLAVVTRRVRETTGISMGLGWGLLLGTQGASSINS